MNQNQDFLIVEDELLIAEMISDILQDAGYKNIRMVDSVEDAVMEIEKSKPDLILTDIALGKDKTGLDLGQLLHDRYHIPFIYVTSHASPEILGKAKHTRPNAYIVKPFKNEDLRVAIEFALFNISQPSAVAKEEEELTVKEGRVIVKLPYDDILFFESDGNYISIVLKNGKKRVVRIPISELESQLKGKVFMRIHKSYVINCNYAQEIGSSYISVGGHELPVGRSFQTAVQERFQKR